MKINNEWKEGWVKGRDKGEQRKDGVTKEEL